ncbi:hypothetical protein IV203_033351 [Nitzschia inconspicua]|uniref:Uncharacterized protein n=1 Tax=Nitzschia inconspicua TaxID=303405 RepID=A0A9K3PFZ2_9STRA|nr:hypothetical protein IV203_033351 [Nitzschia inconspicua]
MVDIISTFPCGDVARNATAFYWGSRVVTLLFVPKDGVGRIDANAQAKTEEEERRNVGLAYFETHDLDGSEIDAKCSLTG